MIVDGGRWVRFFLAWLFLRSREVWKLCLRFSSKALFPPKVVRQWGNGCRSSVANLTRSTETEAFRETEYAIGAKPFLSDRMELRVSSIEAGFPDTLCG